MEVEVEWGGGSSVQSTAHGPSDTASNNFKPASANSASAAGVRVVSEGQVIRRVRPDECTTGAGPSSRQPYLDTDWRIAGRAKKSIAASPGWTKYTVSSTSRVAVRFRDQAAGSS
jgi:hypothetical protein